MDIAGSNPAGGTTAFEQVKAYFSSWPVFVSAHVRQARAPNVRQISRKPPSDSPWSNGKDPARAGRNPAARLTIAPARPLGYRFACPFACPSATRFARPFARPFATRGNPSGARPSATPRALGLGYPLATPRRAPLPVRSVAPPPRTAAHACRSPQAKGGPPHGTARPSALDIPLCARPRPRRKSRAPAHRRRHP